MAQPLSPPPRTLPARPGLDQLRRQAKELLAAFLAGDSEAVAEVKAHYRGAGPSGFALHDAQLVLARSYGFASWPKLKAYVDGANVQRLCEAVRSGDLAKVEAMLKARPELARMDLAESDEHQALHFAVLDNAPRMVRLLMRYRADPHKGIYPHRDATTPLTLAVERGYDEIAAIIQDEESRREALRLEAKEESVAPGPKRTVSQPRSRPTLQEAVAAGDLDRIRDQHAKGVLRKPTDDGGRLLSVAVQNGQPEMLALLLDLGFDPDERMRVPGLEEAVYSWGLPLQLCARSGQLEMAKMLLARGADPNGEVYAAGTPVSAAYRARDAAMLELLEGHGGVVTAATAGYHRDTELARRLIAAEDAGRLPARTVPTGSTVAEQLIDGDCGDPEIVRMALERIDWPRDDPRWRHALRGPLAFWNHIPWIESQKWPFGRGTYLTCFRLILDRCDPNMRGSFGRTVLHDVVAMGRRKGVRDWITEDEILSFAATLLDAGVRLDVRDDLLKSTPLGWACRWGREKLVKLMLDRGADPVEADAEPWARPLAWAQKMGHAGIVALLQR